MQTLAPAAPYSSRERWLVGIIICIVALAHIASFAYLSSLAAHNPQAQPYPIVAGDSQEYAELADNLLTDHAYFVVSNPLMTRQWPPGYATFLAGIKWMTGSFTFAVVIQSLLSFLAVFLIYAIARRFVTPAFAACAALLYGLDPMVVFSDTAIITDGLFASLLIFVIYLTFFQSRMRGVLRWSLIGILLGIAVMTRAIGEFLIILVPAAFLLREWMRMPQWREEKYLAPALIAYLLCVSIIVVPWMVRNHEKFGVYEIAQGGADDLLHYDVRYFLAWKEMGEQVASVFYPTHHYNDPQFDVVDTRIAAALAAATPRGGDPENYSEKVALDFILQDPIHYALFSTANTLSFFISGSFSAYEEIAHQVGNNTDLSASTLNAAATALSELRHPGLASAGALVILLPIVFEVFYWFLVCVFALWGIWFERRRFEIWIFAGLVVYFAALTGPLSIARYRIPAEPWLLLLAVVGLYATVSYFAKLRVIKHTRRQ